MEKRLHIILVSAVLIFSYVPTRTVTSILGSGGMIKMAEKRLNEALGPFARVAVDFLPNLVAQAGGKEKAKELIIKHKRLTLELFLIKQILAEIRGELKNALPAKKILLTLPIRLIEAKNKQKQKQLLAMEAQYPELTKLGLIRWIIKPILGGGLLPTISKIIDKLYPKKRKLTPFEKRRKMLLGPLQQKKDPF